VINCGFPGYLVNGYILGSSYLYGDIVRYACRPLYRLHGGDATQRCAQNGLWHGRRPSCKGKNISYCTRHQHKDSKYTVPKHFIVIS